MEVGRPAPARASPLPLTDHDVLREFQSSSSTPTSAWVWIEDHVYRGSGLLLAGDRPPVEGGERHFHLDHLGTPRLVTGPNGGLIALYDYAPYGAEITSPCQETNLGFDREEPNRFTMHTRDFAPSCADQVLSITCMRGRIHPLHPGFSPSTPAMEARTVRYRGRRRKFV